MRPSKSRWMALGIAILGCLGCSGEPARVVEDTEWSVLPVSVERQATEPDPRQDRWSKALATREFVFPRDHAAHRDYRIEWWYYTGNLDSARGRRWGYQLTFFRTGLQFESENPSSWTVRDLYTAHFALSDIQRRDHRLAQRTSRQGIDFAGAQEERYHVWNGDWRVGLDGERHVLEAKSDDFAISLSLHPVKPYVLHGEGGLSRKGPTLGNASFYYSATRMRTEGTITIDGQEHSVQGESWMDHEFSTSFLEPGQLGWDWFAIQLEDGTEIMLYQMRRDDGTSDPYSSGTYVDRQGRASRLHSQDFQLTPDTHWTSPHTQGKYPLSWKVVIQSLDMQLEVQAAFPDQEMTTQTSVGIPYWEGSILVSGRVGDQSVSGRGYLELTGYAGTGLGSLMR